MGSPPSLSAILFTRSIRDRCHSILLQRAVKRTPRAGARVLPPVLCEFGRRTATSGSRNGCQPTVHCPIGAGWKGTIITSGGGISPHFSGPIPSIAILAERMDLYELHA